MVRFLTEAFASISVQLCHEKKEVESSFQVKEEKCRAMDWAG